MCFSGKSQVVERVLSEDPDSVSTMTTTSPQGRTELLRPDGSPVRVLVVDDELSITELLSMALRYEGWQIRSAGDALGIEEHHSEGAIEATLRARARQGTALADFGRRALREGEGVPAPERSFPVTGRVTRAGPRG